MLQRIDRLMWLLCLLAITDTFGYAIVIPLLPFHAERYGVSTIGIGAVLGCYSLCQLFAAPIVGGLSERWGRRRLLLASQAGSAAGFVLLALSRSFWPLAASRVIDGLTAGNVSLIYATVLDRYPREEWGWRFGLGSATGLGILAGLAVTTLLAGLGLPAASLAALALCLAGMGILVMDKRRAPLDGHLPGRPATHRRSVATAISFG